MTLIAAADVSAREVLIGKPGVDPSQKLPSVATQHRATYVAGTIVDRPERPSRDGLEFVLESLMPSFSASANSSSGVLHAFAFSRSSGLSYMSEISIAFPSSEKAWI